MNIIFDGAVSINGYQSKMLNKLEKRLPFDRCVLINKDNDGQDIYNSEKYLCVNYDICAHDKYEEVYDFNEMLPLDRGIMEAMRVYEPMAVMTLMRMYEVSFFHYAEAKQIYLRHLRFWNHIFENEKIGYVVITEVPHHAHDYIIYALAKIKGIKICLLPVCQIYLRRIIGDSLENLGKRITMDYYTKYADLKNVELAPDIEEFYQRKKYGNIAHHQSSMLTKEEKNIMVGNVKKLFQQDVSVVNFWKAGKRLIKLSVMAGIQDKSLESFGNQWYKSKKSLDNLFRARRKMKHMKNPAYFDKMSVKPNYTEKYVVYFLHLQPEATTMPQAGVFVEQELAIKILAASLEKRGIYLYVKEHFVQQKRERDFYDELARIRNVKLIHSEEGSKELIMHSMAVATCTGTVILEAVINGIPALVFGTIGLDEGPGIYQVGNVEECEAVYKKIFDTDYHIEQREVRNYLKAFEAHSCRAYPDAKSALVDGLSMEESSENIAKAAAEFYYELLAE